MTAEELMQREQEAKMRKLENSELMLDPIEHDATEDAKNDTFANQLLTKILNNLQFSITNIHIRYEDNISTNHRFAAGITLSELSAITTDENWIANTISETVNTIHKVSTTRNEFILESENWLLISVVGYIGIAFSVLGYQCFYTDSRKLPLAI